MDWSKQSREMSDAWLEGQRTAWEQWTRAVSGMQAQPGAMGGPMAGAQWERMLAAWREAVDGALHMQAGWIERWAAMGRQIEGEDEAKEWAAQGREMMSGWLEAQRSLWAAFFDAAAAIGPAKPTNPFAEATAAWQDAVTNMAEMQAEWARTWGGDGGGSGSVGAEAGGESARGESRGGTARGESARAEASSDEAADGGAA